MKDLDRSGLERLAREKSEESSALLKSFLDRNAGTIARAAEQLASRFQDGQKLLIFGNGGSAADAQHIAAEFINRLSMEHRALPAIALTTDTSVLTAIANDRSFAQVFSRQIEALGRENDVAWGISTSGQSENVLSALLTARQRGMLTIFSTGEGGKRVEADFLFAVEHSYSARVQEVHLVLAHILCELVETIMFGGSNG
ncbi:MAG TPA: SIS domain-containing protein [bacterium]|nr:SIS domain-containing protein [bacterium]